MVVEPPLAKAQGVKLIKVSRLLIIDSRLEEGLILFMAEKKFRLTAFDEMPVSLKLARERSE